MFENEDLESLSTNEILLKIKQYEIDYEALKLKMLKDYDTMVEMENRYAKANDIILKRLKKI
jgi:hypothetical protein